VPAAATNLFLGPGTNYFSAGATIDGAAQVGGVDLATQTFIPGNASVADSIDGLGRIDVLDGSAGGSVLTWSNGALGLLSVNIDTNSQLLVRGDVGTSRQLVACVINNSGFCSLLSGGLDLSQGAAISNLSGGTFQVASDGAFSGVSFPFGGVFDNAGTIIKSSGGVTQFGATGSGQAPDFNNSGLVSIGSGQLKLANGESSGTFQIASNTVLWFWGGTHILKPGASFDGPGSVRLLQGLSAPTLLITPMAITKLEVGTNGTLQGAGIAATDDIQLGTLITSDNGLLTNGNFIAQNVQMLDSSMLAGSVLSVSNTLWLGGGIGSSLQLSGSVLNNSGVCQWLALGPVSCGAGAILNNLAGGSLNIQTDAAVVLAKTGPQLLINNSGSFVKNGGSGTSTMMADFNNSGRVEIKTGSLSFAGTLLQSLGSTLVDEGATLGATSFNLQGGNLSGAGTVAAPVNNNGIVAPGTSSPGILTLAPVENYQQSAAGTLLVELGGTTPGTQFDKLEVGGASLNGRLQVSLLNGFVPQPGQQFEILTCTSQTGAFSSLDVQPSGILWVIRYQGTNVTLVVGTEVTLTEPVLSGGIFHMTFSTIPGLSYVVETSDTLHPPTWQIFTTVFGDGSTKTVTDNVTQNQRFYRLMLQ